MRVSRFYLSTLKEAPAEAEVVSQQLMLRAGLIKKVSSGIYSWMPLGLVTLRRVEQVVREEMNRAGALECYLPHVIPAELWQETGRWDQFGPQLLKIRDRQERDFLFGPTHEEPMTDIVRKDIRSYRQLPVNLYQIQVKFRDEIRPRFGVMRGREFLMKDAYSFDVDRDALMRSYRAMYDAYTRIFTRLGLRFRAVEADTGAIGGFASHEFQVLAESGEDAIAWCPAVRLRGERRAGRGAGPGRRARRARRGDAQGADARPVDLRGSHRAAGHAARAQRQVPDGRRAGPGADAAGPRRPHGQRGQDRQAAGARRLALGERRRDRRRDRLPSRLPRTGRVCRPEVPLIVDRTVAAMSDFVCGANEADFHLAGVNFGRDCREPDLVADLRNVVAGDPSPDGKGTLDIVRGIEVGHVFALGTKYSEAMGATYLDAQGQSHLIEMGCYGIGVTRVVAAAIEQNHDDRGIVWPEAMAPFAVAIAPIGYDRSEAVRAQADRLHDELAAAGVEVLLDDRGERPGVMFADLELIGIPHRVTIGDRGLKEGKVEYQHRRDTAATPVAADAIAAFLRDRLGRA